MKINELDWLLEAEEQEQNQAAQNQTPPPQNQPNTQANPVNPVNAPASANQPPTQEDDVTQDPVVPDKDPQDTEKKDFEQWKHDFCELSISNDVEGMVESISQVRNRQGLEPAQRRFVEDNLQILLYRRETNIKQANKEMRYMIRHDLDKTTPGSSIIQHFIEVVKKDIVLQQTLIKMYGMYSQKGDIHRKFMAAILGAVMVGGGQENPDLIYFDKDYSVKISTRYNSQYEINLGKWSLKKDDPSRYLSEPELERLQNGSPDEKQSLRRRIIAESISAKFKERAFLIHIVHTDGSIMHMSWDFGDSLLSAYRSGKIVVHGQENSEKECQISDTGEIISIIDVDLKFVKESGETNDNGVETIEVPFIERRNGILYIVADMETLKLAANTISGLIFTEMPFSGNSSEVINLIQCVPGLTEILNRSCGI